MRRLTVIIALNELNSLTIFNTLIALFFVSVPHSIKRSKADATMIKDMIISSKKISLISGALSIFNIIYGILSLIENRFFCYNILLFGLSNLIVFITALFASFTLSAKVSD